MIELQKVTKRFDNFLAVDQLDFEVNRGEVLGFLGPNGAGKSTTMKMITGYLRPSAGRILVDSIDVADNPLAVQAKLGYLPEGSPCWSDMTPRQLLEFVVKARGFDTIAAHQAMARAIEMTELYGVLDQPIETLSKGYRCRVGLAQAIIHNPNILIMDEPTDGLDPNQKFHIRNAITEMAKDKAIIISTHILEEVGAICSRAIIIDHGRIVASGTPAALSARSRYCGAVTLTIKTEQAKQTEAELKKIKHVTIEKQDFGSEMSFTLVPSATNAASDQSLFDQMTTLIGEHDWDVEALALETGRLDDVFHQLTRRDNVISEVAL